MDEALLEERLNSLQNLLCAEEHIIENLSKNIDSKGIEKYIKSQKEQLTKLKEIRNKLIKKTFKLKKDKGEYKNNITSVWCTLKHLLLSEYHTTECINKFNNKEIIEELKMKKEINILIKKNIDIIKKSNLKKCNKCEDDLTFIEKTRKVIGRS